MSLGATDFKSRRISQGVRIATSFPTGSALGSLTFPRADFVCEQKLPISSYNEHWGDFQILTTAHPEMSWGLVHLELYIAS